MALHRDKCINNIININNNIINASVCITSACHLFTSTPSRSKKGQGQRHRMTPNDVQDALTTFPSLAAGASQITSFIARNDPLKYAFMFPIVTGVAITCQLAGIGGAVA
jgi:hypothetical protein